MQGGSGSMETAWGHILTGQNEQLWSESVQWSKGRYFRLLVGSGQVYLWNTSTLAWDPITAAQMTTYLLDGVLTSALSRG